MGNRPIFAGSPTIEVNLSDWEALNKKEGRVSAACDYMKHVLESGGYFGREEARTVLVLLGENINKTEAKTTIPTETEEEIE